MGFITRLYRLGASKGIQLFGHLHSGLFNVPLTAWREPADQFDEGPTEFLHDDQGRRFKDRVQVFGRPIIGQERET